MKLLMKRAFTVVLAAVLLFGCGEDNNKTGGNELTPQENKAKLEQRVFTHSMKLPVNGWRLRRPRSSNLCLKSKVPSRPS